MRKFITYSLLSILLLGKANAQIGFGTASPNSMLDVRGAIAFSVQSFTGNLTADITHHTLLFKGTTAATLTLPNATTCTGRIYIVKNASTTSPAPVVTIQPVASQTIAGFSTAVLDEPYETMRIISNGTNWIVFNESIPSRVSATVNNGWYQGGNTQSVLKNLGTTSNTDMSFITGNTERMRLDVSGFLGINTDPVKRLHFVNENNETGNNYIFDDYGTTNTAGFFIRRARGTVSSPADLQSGDLIAQLRFAGRFNNTINNSTGAGFDSYYLGSGSTNVTDLRVFTSGTEQIRFDANGNVGIGTSTFGSTASTIEQLIVDAGNTSSYNLISGKGSIDNYLQLNIRNTSSGSNASSDIVATADNGNESENYIDMGVNSGGYTNITYPIISGASTSYVYATGEDFIIGNGSAGYNLVFFTGGYALTNERMRITAAGNVGMGTSSPSDKLSVAGNIIPSGNNDYSMGTSAKRWTAVWAANGAIQTSDARLKENIQPLIFDAQKIMQINAVQYHWKSDPAGRRKIGFLAQQVKQLVPEVVVNNEQSGTLGINYSEIVPVLIALLQQQQQTIEALNKELRALEEE